jgi:hypothetical protein|eukprot:scaffold2956_cov227-Chaetoceros_neogracile.AAC.2
MDRSTLLSSLPFLYAVSPHNGSLIWKQHWDILSQYRTGKDEESDKVEFFPFHALSIEPVAHHVGATAGVAFFSNKRRKVDSWNNTDSSSSSATEMKDPALVKFNAYLLPASVCSGGYTVDENGKKMPVNQALNHNSPVNLSISTPMTKSQSPKTPSGERASNGIEETNVLYFVIDEEVFCVDHCQIRTIEIEEASTIQTRNSNDCKMPMSMLLTFDSCTFRIFYDSVISNAQEKMISDQESMLQNSFNKMKSFMLLDGAKLAEFRSSSDSFYEYLCLLSASNHGDSSGESHTENGQTSHDAIMTEEGTNECNGSMEKGSEVTRNDLSETSDKVEGFTDNLSLSERLDAYENSWSSLQSIHALLSLNAAGKTASNLDQNDVCFVALANKSAKECLKSYVASEQTFIDGEIQADVKLSEIQESMDEVLQNIFPAKKGHMALMNHDEDDLGRQIKNQLSRYKDAVNTKHRIHGFIPKR